MGRLERVDSGVASHESNHGSLHGRVQTEMIDDVVIETGSVEAGAGGDNDMGDGFPLIWRQCQLVQSTGSELRREFLKGLHPACGVGKVSCCIEVFGVAPYSVV